MKYLIINADDFGYSPIFNEKIIELLQGGQMTSTTVMVNWITDEQKDQVEKLKELSKTRDIGVGLHLEFKDSNFTKQIEEQLEKFRKIFEFEPSHLDIHKSSMLPESRQVVNEYCNKLGIPCRNWGQQLDGAKSTSEKFLLATEGLRSVRDFADIENWLKNLKDDNYYEICFHPGSYDPNSKSSLNKKRESDAENILKMDKILPELGIEKISFLDL